MKLSQSEMILVGLLIVYIAFYTQPAPLHVLNALQSPMGHAVWLLAILYTTVYQSLIVGVFLGIAYVMTASRTTEYMENPTPAKSDDKPQPKSAGTPAPPTKGLVGEKMAKPHGRLDKHAQKKGTPPPPKHDSPVPPKPAMKEHFSAKEKGYGSFAPF